MVNSKRSLVLCSILVASAFAIFSIVGCGDSAPTLQSIAVTPSPGNGTVGGPTVPLTATGTYSDGTTSTTIAGLTWSSSDEATATVDASGVVTCVGGDGVTPATITASAPSVAGGSTMVTGTTQFTCALAG